MGWNTLDFVLSASSQFNGGPDCVRDIGELCNVLHTFKSKYRVAFHKNMRDIVLDVYADKFRHTFGLPRWCNIDIDDIVQAFPQIFDVVYKGKPNFSLSPEDDIIFRCRGENVELYQSMMQKNKHHVDLMGRHAAFMGLVWENCEFINAMYNEAFNQHFRTGRPIDQIIYEETEAYFRSLHVDEQMIGILKGYFTNMPIKTILMWDLESDPASQIWLDPAYKVITADLREKGVNYLGMLSGKGRHILTAVNLLNDDGSINPDMMRLMAIGGTLQGETIRKLSAMYNQSRKTEPTPLLAQRAYQGACRLQQFRAVNSADLIRAFMRLEGMDDWYNYTDTEDESVICDLTSDTRQIEVGDFGESGSIYGKKPGFKARIPYERFENGIHQVFFNGVQEACEAQENPERARNHLIANSSSIPSTGPGIMAEMDEYDSSRMKNQLHNECDIPLNYDLIRQIRESNYRRARRLTRHATRTDYSTTDFVIDNPQPASLNPKFLKQMNWEMAEAGMSIYERRLTLAALYGDQHKYIDENFGRNARGYARSARIGFITILEGEKFKG